jgi:hypothetical protein
MYEDTVSCSGAFLNQTTNKGIHFPELFVIDSETSLTLWRNCFQVFTLFTTYEYIGIDYRVTFFFFLCLRTSMKLSFMLIYSQGSTWSSTAMFITAQVFL